jgi:arylformamidase
MRIIDLSVPIGPGTLSPPSVNLQLRLTPRFRGPGYWRASSVEMVLHTGSHVDFSAHVHAEGETAGDVSLDRISGEAVVINVGPCPPNYGIGVGDLDRYAPEIRSGDIVLVRTDWTDRMWGRFPEYYLTSPYCTVEAVRWIIARRPKAIGFDCFSEYSARLPDFTSEDFIIHKIILESGAYYFQQMTNLGAIPPGRRVVLFAPCLRIREAEGSPARFFAVLE